MMESLPFKYTDHGPVQTVKDISKQMPRDVLFPVLEAEPYLKFAGSSC